MGRRMEMSLRMGRGMKNEACEDSKEKKAVACCMYISAISLIIFALLLLVADGPAVPERPEMGMPPAS